jgi:sugar phosphate isomerase/epimerase
MTRLFLLTPFVALAAMFSQPTQPISPSYSGAPPANFTSPRDRSGATALGWELGTQAWTFRDRSAFEAIDTAKALGLTAIELFPGQQLSKELAGVKVGPDMDGKQRQMLKDHLKAAGVRAASFGVTGFTTDEPAARKIFAFAKDMGMTTISCEPDLNAWDLLETLADEYDIKLAVHDHPKPSTYWNPDTVLESIKDRSERLGACADTGHWSRSGLVPVECLKKLEGHIFTLHFKDIKNGEDHPWGTGDGDARGMLKELQRQSFKGVILVEYETGSGAELESNVRRCIAFFDKTASELAEADASAPAPR